MDGVWVGETPCSQPTLDVGYMPKVSNQAQFVEMFVLYSFQSHLGHVVCRQGLMVDPAKIVLIINLEAQRSVKDLRTTLGHTGYYRKFIKSYAQITTPMEKSLKKDATFCWNDECQKSLYVQKEKMVTATILVFLNWKNEFHVHVDASCIVLGVVLTHVGEGELDHPIAFASRKLSKVEKKYSTTECEGLAMVYAL